MPYNLRLCPSSLSLGISLTLSLAVLLPSCAPTSGGSSEQLKSNTEFVAAKNKIVGLLEGNFSRKKSIGAYYDSPGSSIWHPGFGNSTANNKPPGTVVTAKIFTETNRYSGVYIDNDLNLNYVQETNNEQADPNNKKSSQYLVQREVKIPILKLNPHGFYISSDKNSKTVEYLVSHSSVSVSAYSYKNVILDTVTINGQSMKNKSSFIIFNFQSEKKSKEFSDALRVLINTIKPGAS